MDDRKDKNENEENESDFWSDALDDIMRRRAWKEWLGEMFDMVMCVMIAAGFTVALTRVFFCISIVSGRSMEPTLQNRDLVVLQRVGRHTDYGDIVACKDWQGELLIKRVIGLEGDVIQIDGPNGVVYRNGQPLDEPYIVADSYYTGEPVQISLRYFDFPQELQVKIYPLKEDAPRFLERWPQMKDGCACELYGVGVKNLVW